MQTSKNYMLKVFLYSSYYLHYSPALSYRQYRVCAYVLHQKYLKIISTILFPHFLYTGWAHNPKLTHYKAYVTILLLMMASGSSNIFYNSKLSFLSRFYILLKYNIVYYLRNMHQLQSLDAILTTVFLGYIRKIGFSLMLWIVQLH